MTASVVGAAELALVLVAVKQIDGSPCCQPASPNFDISSIPNSSDSETSSSSAPESASATESDSDVEASSDRADSAGS